MGRLASRTARALAVAALPVLVAGCSSGSSGSSGGSGASGAPDGKKTPSASASASPSLAPAKYTRLPNPCGTLGKKTVADLVPKAKSLAGQPLKVADPNLMVSCSWNGLDGYTFHWLDVELRRTDSVPGVGSAEQRAEQDFTHLKSATGSPDDLKRGTDPVIRPADLGDDSQLVSAELVKDKNTYRQVTVIARRSNLTVTITYEGAGFEGTRTPAAKDIEDGALKAAKEALTAATVPVTAAS
jgi:Protein of unknown function (DUF3558)